MAKAKKLPSGTWRCQVYSDGKRVSFTAVTKSEAERLAREYSESKKRHGDVFDLTVKEAVGKYISLKEGVLSPSTIGGYVKLKRYFEPLDAQKIYQLTSADMQLFISDLHSKGKSPKTIRNAYGLLISSINMFMPEIKFRVSFPRKAPLTYNTPDADQIRTLIDAATPELRLCILLGACGMRRGEISAIKYGDVNYRTRSIYVHADMVEDKEYQWIYKDMPKNAQSIRMVPVTDEIIDMIGYGNSDDFVTGLKPDHITRRFIRLRNKCGLSCRFHDLRHYYASVMATVMPRAYVESFGGWSRGSKVLDSVYVNAIDSEKETHASTSRTQLSELIAHEIAHDSAQAL